MQLGCAAATSEAELASLYVTTVLYSVEVATATAILQDLPASLVDNLWLFLHLCSGSLSCKILTTTQ